MSTLNYVSVNKNIKKKLRLFCRTNIYAITLFYFPYFYVVSAVWISWVLMDRRIIRIVLSQQFIRQNIFLFLLDVVFK